MRSRDEHDAAGAEFRVDPDRLRWRCDPGRFSFTTTEEIGECPIQIIGQARAVEALRLGLVVRSQGYDVFVVGDVGSGRSTTVRRMLAGVERGEAAPADVVYVHNFTGPDEPRLLLFPAGQGIEFRRAMERTVGGARDALRQLFESDDYRARKTAVLDAGAEQQKAALKQFEAEVGARGFALVQVQAGPLVRPELFPLVEGKPTQLPEIESWVEEGKISSEEFERIREAHAELRGGLEAKIEEFRILRRELRQRLSALDRELAAPLIEERIADVRDRFDVEGVGEWLDQVAADIVEHLARFRSHDEEDGGAADDDETEAADERSRYTVNVVVDHRGTRGRPIIWEMTPSYRNLFGTIEKRQPSGGGRWCADHTQIRAGSVHRAAGGFLVLDAMDVLVEPGVWATLKRTLRNRSAEIQAFDPAHGAAALSLKPQPVPVELRVVMIGTRQIYNLLYGLDEDFKKIFKVKAEFATRTERNDDEIQNYVCFIHKKCSDEGLPPFHRDAVASVVEHAVRLAGHHARLTTRFGEVADLIRESGFWARQAGAERVEGPHVDRALEQRVRRVDLLAEMLRERIAEGTQLLDVTGEQVGQVNGLAVLDVGDHVFGQPSRITATTAVGRAGIIDIEREAEMGGAIHTKGMLILAGFLRSRFAQDKPLALSASLCFEQSYGRVDGDSASCAELYSLLSSLTGVPIRQGIAVTGSVNQMGEVQPIGGVNEKVEGYFDLCRVLGLEGVQGVLIPRANLPHLMLRKDVVRAVREDRFRVWSAATVEDGIEVLTGRAAGERGPDGAYPADSVFGLLDARLAELAEQVRRYGRADGAD